LACSRPGGAVLAIKQIPPLDASWLAHESQRLALCMGEALEEISGILLPEAAPVTG
jgi:hypothetical protein